MEPPIIAVSDKAQFQRVVRLEDPGVYDTQGRVVSPKKRKLVAQFVKGGAPAWVIEQASQRFEFKGRADGEPIQMMLAVFDSAQAAKVHKWTEEEHDAVVRDLRDTQNPYWFIVEEPRVDAPWPSYDKLSIQGNRSWEKVAARNIETATEIGVPLDTLIAYERQNRNDERILAAYRDALEADAPALEETLVEA